MRRTTSLTLAAALLPAAAPPPLDARNDARDVLEVVVRSESAIQSHVMSDGPLCVQSRLNGVSVGSVDRWQAREFLLLSWRTSDLGPDPLPAGDREAVREAMRSALSASTQRRWLTRVDQEWVTPALAFCTNTTDRRLVFSSPVVVGDVAFVGIALECWSHCGYGWGDRVALRRTARGWATVARRTDFSN
jgi:hypothetical protein